LLSKAFLGAYIGASVALVYFTYAGVPAAIETARAWLGVVGQVAASGAEGTAFPQAAAVYLLLLLPLDVAHSLWIAARTRRIAPREEPATRPEATVLFLFPLLWLLLQSCIFLIPASAGRIGRLTAGEPAAYALVVLMFLYAAHAFLGMSVLAWRDLAARRPPG